MTEYLVPYESAESEFEEKRSRFISHVFLVESEAEARARIDEMKKKSYDARHNCWCYLLREGGVVRYSDDGEPQGTAGVPVLDVLEKSDVKDVCVVATRYFGGILLGGGGLVRAYSHTAKIALDSGVIVTMAKCDELCVLSDYNYYGKLASLIPENGGTVISADFADNVKVKFSIPCEKSDNIKNLIVDTSNGRFFAEKIGEKYAETEILK